MIKKEIVSRLQTDVNYLMEKCATHNPGDLWSSRIKLNLKKFIHPDQKINLNALENFRRNEIFITEIPSTWGNKLLPFNWLSGGRRRQLRYLKERLLLMKEYKEDIKFLKKYPINPVGNPLAVKYDGYHFNKRWSNNIRYLSLATQYLKEILSSSNSSLIDIGGGYGIFISLLKQEFSKLKLAVMEFPEQLLLNYYFIANTFPKARINSIKEIFEIPEINREFIDKYDFILIPIECFKKIQKGCFNIVSNFYSLGEMSEDWFNSYMNSNILRDAEYFFSINRFESRPSYDTNLNILSYKLHEYDQLYFQIGPYEKYFYEGKYKIFSKKIQYTSQFFEFIGKRKA